MSKEILRFKGLSLNKDEQSAEHGELSLCAGVELHDGALRPSVLEGSKVENALKVGNDVATLLYVHETASYRHFIGLYNHGLYWFKDDGTAGSTTAGSTTAIHKFDDTDNIISVNSVGNTLVVLAGSGVHYVLWKDGTYKYLGTEIPFVEIYFGLSKDHKASYDLSTIWGATAHSSYNAWRNTDSKYPKDIFVVESSSNVSIKGEDRSWFTEMVWALINQANNTIANDGHFYAPFFIRYCYRLYDGSMVMHSAPVFMNVSEPYTYRVSCINVMRSEEDGHVEVFDSRRDVDFDDDVFSVNKTTLRYQPNNVGIQYRIDGTDETNTVIKQLKENWSDIVKSIDIFVSPMMAREDPGKQITGLSIKTRKADNTEYAIKDVGVRQADIVTLTKYYSHTETIVPDPAHSTTQTYNDILHADIPTLNEDEYLSRLKNNSTFFKIKSLDIVKDTIGTNYSVKDLELNKTVVATLTSQEQMKDDYHSHNKVTPADSKSGMSIYNHRLNLYGMSEKLFGGFSINSMVNYTERNTTIYYGYVYIKGFVIEIITEHGKKMVGNLDVYKFVTKYTLCKSFLFYPDSRASRIIIYTYDGDLELPMEAHSFLNGSIVTSLFNKTTLEDSDFQPASESYPTLDDVIPMPNKLVTSEADNPYFFPVEGRNTVGLGSIVGVAAVTRALSQGQVGDHDLAVFSTDGIWVMKVSGEGTYSSMHNISREVCTNPKSICQLDQSVVFATERNLSRFVESDVVSMTNMLDGPVKDWSSLFGSFFDSETDGEQVTRQLQMPTPVELFNSGRTFYDYAGSRVVVLPEDTSNPSVAMVFSIRDLTWSTMAIPAIMAVVPGYPSPFVQWSDGNVTILDKTYDYRDEGDTVPGLILTRTLTFSETMDVIRGFRQYADCDNAPMLFFYGSNDQRQWQVIGQSGRWFYNYMPGNSFRFFKVAVYMRMLPSEEYQQLVLEVVNKYGKL